MKMQYLQTIAELAVEQAQYRVTDSTGQTLTLLVAYADNYFTVEGETSKFSPAFLAELDKLAKGLLARKHGTNLAKREQYL